MSDESQRNLNERSTPAAEPAKSSASGRTLKNVGAASNASTANGTHHNARTHGDGSGRTGS